MIKSKQKKRAVPRSARRVVGIQVAADYAGVSRWLIRKWINAGQLPYVRYPSEDVTKDRSSREDKVDLDDLDRFIENSKLMEP